MKKLWNAITYPFITFAVLLEESKNINEDGSWDAYWAKKNRKAELRKLKAEYRKAKAEIKAKWGANK